MLASLGPAQTGGKVGTFGRRVGLLGAPQSPEGDNDRPGGSPSWEPPSQGRKASLDAARDSRLCRSVPDGRDVGGLNDAARSGRTEHRPGDDAATSRHGRERCCRRGNSRRERRLASIETAASAIPSLRSPDLGACGDGSSASSRRSPDRCPSGIARFAIVRRQANDPSARQPRSAALGGASRLMMMSTTPAMLATKVVPASLRDRVPARTVVTDGAARLCSHPCSSAFLGNSRSNLRRPTIVRQRSDNPDRSAAATQHRSPAGRPSIPKLRWRPA